MLLLLLLRFDAFSIIVCNKNNNNDKKKVGDQGGVAGFDAHRKVIRSGGLAGRERRGFAAAALRSVKRRVVSAAKVAGLDLRRRPTLGETAKLLGVELSADFVKEELAMLAAIRSGQAVAHHLEPSYLEALSKASSVQ